MNGQSGGESERGLEVARRARKHLPLESKNLNDRCIAFIADVWAWESGIDLLQERDEMDEIECNTVENMQETPNENEKLITRFSLARAAEIAALYLTEGGEYNLAELDCKILDKIVATIRSYSASEESETGPLPYIFAEAVEAVKDCVATNVLNVAERLRFAAYSGIFDLTCRHSDSFVLFAPVVDAIVDICCDTNSAEWKKYPFAKDVRMEAATRMIGNNDLFTRASLVVPLPPSETLAVILLRDGLRQGWDKSLVSAQQIELLDPTTSTKVIHLQHESSQSAVDDPPSLLDSTVLQTVVPLPRDGVLVIVKSIELGLPPEAGSRRTTIDCRVFAVIPTTDGKSSVLSYFNQLDVTQAESAKAIKRGVKQDCTVLHSIRRYIRKNLRTNSAPYPWEQYNNPRRKRLHRKTSRRAMGEDPDGESDMSSLSSPSLSSLEHDKPHRSGKERRVSRRQKSLTSLGSPPRLSPASMSHGSLPHEKDSVSEYSQASDSILQPTAGGGDLSASGDSRESTKETNAEQSSDSASLPSAPATSNLAKHRFAKFARRVMTTDLDDDVVPAFLYSYRIYVRRRVLFKIWHTWYERTVKRADRQTILVEFFRTWMRLLPTDMLLRELIQTIDVLELYSADAIRAKSLATELKLLALKTSSARRILVSKVNWCASSDKTARQGIGRQFVAPNASGASSELSIRDKTISTKMSTASPRRLPTLVGKRLHFLADRTMSDEDAEEASRLTARDVAQILTTIDWEYFKAVNLGELIDKTWHSGHTNRTPNLASLAERFNGVAWWTATRILLAPTDKARKQAKEAFIEIATELKQMRSFQSAMAVLSGLSHISVLRLKKLHDSLSSSAASSFERLEEFFDLGSNYKKYRAAVAAESDSGLYIWTMPYVAVTLSDLEFLRAGNAAWSSDEHVNADLLWMVRDQVWPFNQFQQCSFPFGSHPSTRLFRDLQCLDDASLEWASYRIERPRGSLASLSVSTADNSTTDNSEMQNSDSESIDDTNADGDDDEPLVRRRIPKVSHQKTDTQDAYAREAFFFALDRNRAVTVLEDFSEFAPEHNSVFLFRPSPRSSTAAATVFTKATGETTHFRVASSDQGFCIEAEETIFAPETESTVTYESLAQLVSESPQLRGCAYPTDSFVKKELASIEQRVRIQSSRGRRSEQKSARSKESRHSDSADDSTPKRTRKKRADSQTTLRALAMTPTPTRRAARTDENGAAVTVSTGDSDIDSTL